jgi:hypothetical protein
MGADDLPTVQCTESEPPICTVSDSTWRVCLFVCLIDCLFVENIKKKRRQHHWRSSTLGIQTVAVSVLCGSGRR